MTLVAYMAVVVAASALVCGHHTRTPPQAHHGAQRARTAPRRGAHDTRTTRTPPRPAHGHTARHWARSQTITYEETA
ncbi:hypothetical protein SGLAM104S_01601 [Streptomyces glaucescens]